VGLPVLAVTCSVDPVEDVEEGIEERVADADRLRLLRYRL
jgi:hypothetical protein